MANQPEPLPPDNEDKLRRLQETEVQIAALEEERIALILEVVEPMKEPAHIIGIDGEKYRVARVGGGFPSYDDAKALAILTPEQVDEVMDLKINGTKFKAAVARWDDSVEVNVPTAINPELVGKIVTISPRRAYAKFEKVK